MTPNTIICGSDTKERRQWFRGASFAHPAKMHLSLQLYLIEHYTKRGEWILDPMAGSGTILVGCALERNVICVELEKKFVDMQNANWEKIKSLGPMLGYKMGEAIILQGDARNLDGLLVDKCIFSPPYSNEHNSGLSEKTIRVAEKIHKRKYTRHSFTGGEDYGSSKNNIGNLPYGKISTVITSPPYAPDNDPRIREKLRPGRTGPIGTIPSDNPKNIANLPYKADTVITSPPYEGSLARDRSTDESYKEDREKTHAGGTVNIEKGYQADPLIKRLRKHGRTDDKAGGPYGRSLGHPYSGAVENIGNLKSDNYLSAMLQVYQRCHKVLKAGGLMCLVTKNFIRNKKIVQLDTDTIKLCEQAGFTLKERLQRKLTQQSFWRITYYQKYPDVPKIEFEDVLIFAS